MMSLEKDFYVCDEKYYIEAINLILEKVDNPVFFLLFERYLTGLKRIFILKLLVFMNRRIILYGRHLG